jgi:hypothetical protein
MPNSAHRSLRAIWHNRDLFANASWTNWHAVVARLFHRQHFRMFLARIYLQHIGKCVEDSQRLAHFFPGGAGETECGQEQECAYPDEHWLDGECGVQSEVVGEAAQKVGSGDDEPAAD